MFKLTLALCVVAASAGYSCDNSKNWINGMRYSQIALTDGCRNGICNANPKYGGSNSNTKALAYCKKTCNTRSGCTGFFFQQHNNGHEICGFYSTALKGASRHGHKAGAVCKKTTGSTDCKFTYQAWTKCSKQCGSGVQYRNVKVSAYPTNGGAACPSSSTRVCNSHKCGDCKFTYGTWTKCSKACGSGVQYRNVKVDTYPAAGGKACPGPSTRVCNSHKCKKQHCKFTYKSWTPCSKACGNGVQYRPVKVTKYPKFGGDACPNKATRVCNSFKCSGNLAAKFHAKHGGAPCKSTYCTYDGAHTEVFMKTRDDFGNILKDHERWHCEHTTGMKCMCTCAKQLPCRLRHHHKKTGYTKDFKLCKPQA
jgi:hypothetical protein